MKKGLILNFSPRIGGNSDIISKEIFNNLKKYFNLELINVNNLKISQCQGCETYCTKYGKCKFNDDMNILYEHFKHDNFLIIVSPIYFYHIPGYAKIVIDRSQPFWVQKYVLKSKPVTKKLSSVILIGATKGKKLFSGTDLTLKYFFDCINTKFDKKLNLYLRSNINLKEIVTNHTKKLKKILTNF